MQYLLVRPQLHNTAIHNSAFNCLNDYSHKDKSNILKGNINHASHDHSKYAFQSRRLSQGTICYIDVHIFYRKKMLEADFHNLEDSDPLTSLYNRVCALFGSIKFDNEGECLTQCCWIDKHEDIKKPLRTVTLNQMNRWCTLEKFHFWQIN